MAAISGVFSNTVRGALAIAEAELACKGVEMEKIKDALEDMRSLLGPISIRHFNTRVGFKHIVGNLFPMLQRQTVAGLAQAISATNVSPMLCQTPLAGNCGRKATQGAF